MDNKLIMAIDIGAESIKVFLGSRQTDTTVSLKSSSFMPSSGYERGEITDVAALAASIKQAVDCVLTPDDHLTGAIIYAGIGSTAMIGQNSLGSIARTSVDRITTEDVDRACRAAVFAAVLDDYEAMHVSPLTDVTAEKGVFLQSLSDSWDSQGLRVRTHIASLPKRVIELITQSLAAQGIHIKGVAINSIVTVRDALPHLEKDAANCVYLDLGAGTTDLVLLADGRIHHSASLPLGGNYITNDIKQCFDVSFAHAEAIKRYYAKLDNSIYGTKVTLDCNDFGTGDKTLPYDFLHDVVESRVDEIVQLIYEYLKPHLDEHIYNTGRRLDKVILAGGATLLPSIVEKITLTFGVKAESVNFPELTKEYNTPLNAACYGIFCHAANEATKLDATTAQTQILKQIQEANTSSDSWGFFKKIFKF
ncbi:MAG: rod shape-determining protein [Sporomusaceae bacterium]|jgi:cell division protein FtsA|nr:rod shape-determining protein [Sporomusaceae bacterium]